MGHAVEKMMFTGKRPWWYGNAMQGAAVGVDLGENAVTSSVAMKEAGLAWRVEMALAGRLDPTTRDLDGRAIWREVEEDRYLIRDSDGSVLGRCSKDYQPLQNAEAFRFLDSLVRDGELLYHTAGSLEEGRRVWILAQTPTSWTIRRRSGAVNRHHAFLLTMLGHDGKTGISIMPTDIRAECANTVGFADSQAERESLVFRIAHTGDVEAKLTLAATALERMATESEERRRVLQAFAQHAMTTEEFVDFATEIFLGLDGEPEQVEALTAKWYEEASPLMKTKMENRVAAVTRTFLGGMGNEGDSAYAALAAFSESIDHLDIEAVRSKIELGKRAANAVRSSWIGAGAERKALVWKRLAERVRR